MSCSYRLVSAKRSRIKPSACRVVASVCAPRALHLRYTQQRFVRRRILPRRHSAPEAHAPYASKARQRSRTCSASAILHRRSTFLFCTLIPYGLAIRRVIVIGNRARRAHVRMAPGVGCRLRTKGNRTWQTIVKCGKASAWTWKPMTSCAPCARPRVRCHESRKLHSHFCQRSPAHDPDRLLRRPRPLRAEGQ